MSNTPTHPITSTDEATTALRHTYYRWLAVLVAAITAGALVGAWLMWDYTGDGSLGSLLIGQSALFGGAALLGVGPFVAAVGARRRWRASIHHASLAPPHAP